MTYNEALKTSSKLGAGKAEGLPYLAMVCSTLALAHAIVPDLVYEGSKTCGLDGNAVRKLDPVARRPNVRFTSKCVADVTAKRA